MDTMTTEVRTIAWTGNALRLPDRTVERRPQLAEPVPVRPAHL